MIRSSCISKSWKPFSQCICTLILRFPDGKMAFIPRATFAYPAKTASWYAGHMARSMRLMGDLLPDVDLVIEARDARLPLTSINGAFDDLLAQSWGPIWNGPDGGTGSGSLGLGSSLAENLVGGKVDRKGKMREKIIAYTKRDLAEAKYEEVRELVERPCYRACGRHDDG